MDELLIAPSILAADFGQIKSEVEMLNKSKSDYIHIDVMDGVFVPNISFGFPVIKSIKKHAQIPLDFHLMIIDPDPYLETCRDHGADVITVHYETCSHLHRTIQSIKSMNLKAGVALNPHTSIDFLKDILADIDLVLIMSVNPGFGGQIFIENTYKKIHKLSLLSQKLNPNLLIEIDGGVTLDNAFKLKESGANMLVAGSSVFNSSQPIDTIHSMKNV